MDHETKYFLYVFLFLGIVILLLQTLVVPLIEIRLWRPDLILALIILLGNRFGSLKGSSAGFFLGIIQDSLTGMPVGITALPKALVGYGAGKMHTYKIAGSMAYLWFILLIFLHELLLYAFFQFKTNLSYGVLVYTRAFPNTIYTLIMLLFVQLFTYKYLNEEYHA